MMQYDNRSSKRHYHYTLHVKISLVCNENILNLFNSYKNTKLSSKLSNTSGVRLKPIIIQSLATNLNFKDSSISSLASMN